MRTPIKFSLSMLTREQLASFWLRNQLTTTAKFIFIFFSIFFNFSFGYKGHGKICPTSVISHQLHKGVMLHVTRSYGSIGK